MSGECIEIDHTAKETIIDCSGFKGTMCITEVDRYLKWMKDNGVDIKKKDVRMKGDMSAATSEAKAMSN